MRDGRSKSGAKELRSWRPKGLSGWVLSISLLFFLQYAVFRWLHGSSRVEKVATDPKSCNTDSLIAWGKKQGIVLHKVTVGEFMFEDTTAAVDYWLESIREKRGLMAISDIQKKEAVVTVPWESCITPQHLKEANPPHLLTPLALAEEKRLEPMEILALWLLVEYHDTHSVWAPYLCMLPRKLGSSLFWSKEKMDRVQASNFLRNQTAGLQAYLYRRFEEVIKPMMQKDYKHLGLNPKIFNFPNFLWAIATVRSRNWGLRVKGLHQPTLVPIADLANHALSVGGGGMLRTNVEEGTEPKSFKLFAGRNYLMGQEVEVSYSNECNDRLYLNYGFALPYNPIECR